LGLSPLSHTDIDVGRFKELFGRFSDAANSATRFVPDAGEYGVWSHGFNVWQENPLAHCVDKKTGRVKAGCNGIDIAIECNRMRFMTQEASVYGATGRVGSSHHPPAAFHLLRGEAIALVYTLVLLDATQELRRATAAALAAVPASG
jgi:hypothetical protein